MKRILLFLAILLCASAASAQCTGSGLAFSCAAGSTSSQISSAISAASNNAIITLAAGSYTISGMAGFNELKGATIICATPPLANRAATVNPCTINAGSGLAFGMNSWTGIVHPNLYRISGFIFNETGQTPIWWGSGCNPCSNGTFTQIRIDHNTFNLNPGGVAMLLDGYADINNQFWGVVDHNTVLASGQAGIFQWAGGLTNPVGTPPPPQLGTGNNMFVEDNILSFPAIGNGSNLGCTDAEGEAVGLVIRHNTSTDCLWSTHGVTHKGGPSNVEFYNNNVTQDAGDNGTGFEGGYRSFHHQGSGKLVAFNNTFTVLTTKSGEIISMAHYRDVLGSVDNGLPECDGTQTYPPDGNRTPTATYQGYPCWNQPGRDVSAPGGNGYKPMYSWNNKWSDTGAKIDITMPDFGGPAPDYHTLHMVNDREVFNSVSNLAQSSPTVPFNGTTGMGFGTLANRPTTCTTSSETAFGNGAAGVGYFATDVGAQGTLYTCSATNTWTVYYTPFTYPHPLVSGAATPGVSISPASFNYGSINVGSNSSQTFTVTSNGTANLVMGSPPATITGTNAGDFALQVVGSQCSNGQTIPASFTCLESVLFSPSTNGSRSAQLNIFDNVSGSPQVIPLSGTGTGVSTVTFLPTSLTFTTAIVGQTSGSQTITMTPSATVNVSSISTTNSQFIVIGGTCPSSGAVSSPCTIIVAFTGTALGVQNASLHVTDDATGSPQTIPLTGTAANLPPGSAPQSFASNTLLKGTVILK